MGTWCWKMFSNQSRNNLEKATFHYKIAVFVGQSSVFNREISEDLTFTL